MPSPLTPPEPGRGNVPMEPGWWWYQAPNANPVPLLIIANSQGELLSSWAASSWYPIADMPGLWLGPCWGQDEISEANEQLLGLALAAKELMEEYRKIPLYVKHCTIDLSERRFRLMTTHYPHGAPVSAGYYWYRDTLGSPPFVRYVHRDPDSGRLTVHGMPMDHCPGEWLSRCPSHGEMEAMRAEFTEVIKSGMLVAISYMTGSDSGEVWNGLRVFTGAAKAVLAKYPDPALAPGADPNA